MSDTSMELFLHGLGEPRIILAEANETLRVLFARLGATPADGDFVFVGEWEEASTAPEADAEEDSHEPANLDLSVHDLELHRHKHIHTSRVRRIEVTVEFNGPPRKRRFSPATTVETVTKWAKRRFNVDPAAGADLVLERQPDKYRPRPDQHLGELLLSGEHCLTFSLVKEVNPQGHQ